MMESIRHAATVIKNSPRLMRRKLESRKARHEPLQDDWLHQREHLMDGVTFYAKKLGRKSMQGQGKECTDIVVKEIVEETKKKKIARFDKRLQKVSIKISIRTLSIEDLDTKEIIDEIPIYRITYCTADANYPKVFAFISKTRDNNESYCFAFLTTKSAVADAIAVTVSQAFSLAYELQKTRLSMKRSKIEHEQDAEAKSLYSEMPSFSEKDSLSESFQRSTSSDLSHSSSSENNEFSFVCSQLRREILLERLESDQSMDEENDPEFFKFIEQRSKPTILSSRSSGVFSLSEVLKFEPASNNPDELSKAKSMEDLLE